MPQAQGTSQFQAKLLQPRLLPGEAPWAFVILPRALSAKLPRRGRTSVDGWMNGQPFRARLEPDGQLSHWLRVEDSLLLAAGAAIGDLVTLEITPVAREPEPTIPADLAESLASAPAAQATWEATTTIARLDWIHWIESARQSKTRAKRITDACSMLGEGKKRVCCFDPSGYYSKALRAPDAQD